MSRSQHTLDTLLLKGNSPQLGYATLELSSGFIIFYKEKQFLYNICISFILFWTYAFTPHMYSIYKNFLLLPHSIFIFLLSKKKVATDLLTGKFTRNLQFVCMCVCVCVCVCMCVCRYTYKLTSKCYSQTNTPSSERR